MKPAIPPLPPVMPPESPLAAHARDHAWMPLAFREDGMAVEDVAVDDGLHPRALHVDDRRLAGDGDCFFQAADAHIGVDRRDEVAASARCLRA